MSETIKEMVLPGTYVEVRAEGLIGVSGIATGNLGVVGTAAHGPVGEVVLLGSYTEAVEIFGAYDAWGKTSPPSLTLTRTVEQLFRGGGSTVYAVRIAKEADLETAQWDLEDATAPVFSLRAVGPGSWANDIEVTLTAGTGLDKDVRTLELQLGKQKETFTGADAGELFDAVNTGNLGSILVKAVPMPNATTHEIPADLPAADRAKILKDGAVPVTTPGADGASAGPNEVGAGLALLAKEAVHIVTVAGLSVAEVGAQVLEHLEATENDGRERIAVLGASSDDLSDIGNDAGSISNPRVILVAPGLVANDVSGARVDLPPAYAAALVAGRLSTLASHVSPTNKDVAATGLTTLYTRAEQKLLLDDDHRVLVLHKNLGFRILKGISTDTGAFRQITTRRIVDYAKAGVRIGANPYIGKLNNSRVRAALKATLDGFLSGMVLDEMLISYDLEVSATRAQEIAGIALVTMTLRPTFSIDFVKVILNLE
jgi:hypothetical protein